MNIPTQDIPYSSHQVTQRELNQDVIDLIYWLQQEILCPDLLPYFEVNKIQETLKGQAESIQESKKELSKANKQRETQYLTLHVIELERVQYFYQQYLRVRLQKIITNGFYYYNNFGEYTMSLKEKEFLKNMVEKQIDYVLSNCLQHYPKTQRNFGVRLDGNLESQNTQQYDDKIGKNIFYQGVQKPDINQYVVIHVNTQRTIHVGSIALSENDRALVCYDDIKIMVPLKSVTLI